MLQDWETSDLRRAEAITLSILDYCSDSITLHLTPVLASHVLKQDSAPRYQIYIILSFGEIFKMLRSSVFFLSTTVTDPSRFFCSHSFLHIKHPFPFSFADSVDILLIYRSDHAI